MKDGDTRVGWRTLLAPLFLLCAYVAGLFLLCLIAVLVALVFGFSISDILKLFSQARSNLYVGQIVNGIFYVLQLVVLLVLVRKHNTAMVAGLRNVLPWVVAAAVAIGAVQAVAEWLLDRHLAHAGLVDFHAAFRSYPGPIEPFLFRVFESVVISPLSEEIYFRGLLMGWLTQRAGVVWAIWINSVLFALLHLRFVETPGVGGWTITVGVLLSALVYSLLALRTRSLWPGIAAHAATNGAFAVLPIVLPW